MFTPPPLSVLPTQKKSDLMRQLKIMSKICKRYIGKFSHTPTIWEVFIKEDGKDFELTKIGKDRFSYEQGEAIFTANEKGKIEHISFGLYSARKVF